jgi:ubiquitin
MTMTFRDDAPFRPSSSASPLRAYASAHSGVSGQGVGVFDAVKPTTRAGQEDRQTNGVDMACCLMETELERGVW